MSGLPSNEISFIQTQLLLATLTSNVFFIHDNGVTSKRQTALLLIFLYFIVAYNYYL